MQEIVFDEDRPAAENYVMLGQALASCTGVVLTAGGVIAKVTRDKHVAVAAADDLGALLLDHLRVSVVKDGKLKSTLVPSVHLRMMLRSEWFKGQFRAVDQITALPMYRADFTLTQPGFNDGPEGFRILSTQPGDARVTRSCKHIDEFLDVMEFATQADRTNAVAAALTVLLRNHWPGGKPIVICTAPKSHAGKDTVLAFARGIHPAMPLSYQETDWAAERAMVDALRAHPDIGVLLVENARLGQTKRIIASAPIERMLTNAWISLNSSKSGHLTRRNDLVLGMSTNFGTLSEDLLNRSLPIHLSPQGDIADRNPRIGNPKLEYLPAHAEDIAAELRGLVENWKEAGQPPAPPDVLHPFSEWARTVGGILAANRFVDFLGNYRSRRILDDPVRQALAELGASASNAWLRPGEWARQTVSLGYAKVLFSAADRDTEAGRERAMGRLLRAYVQEKFTYYGDDLRVATKLESGRRRFEPGENPSVRYRFATLER
jgi:hypothetical protein